jgi:diacylglycerol kinase family enzyme
MIPLGTANVLADEIGLPRAPRALATVLAHGPTRPIRLGVVNSRRFCMMAGAGFDAGVVAAVTPALKARLGPFAYVLRTAQLAFAESAAGCTVTIDGTVHAAASAVVCKGRLYGGPFVAAPEANVADDLLHVVLMRGRGWASVLRYGAALMTGRIARLADVEIVAGRNIVIEGQAGAPIQADGDIVARLPATIAIDPVTLSVICSG